MQMSLFASSLLIFKTCGVQVYWLCAGLYWSLLAGLLHRLMATLMYGFENRTRSQRPIDAEKSIGVTDYQIVPKSCFFVHGKLHFHAPIGTLILYGIIQQY